MESNDVSKEKEESFKKKTKMLIEKQKQMEKAAKSLEEQSIACESTIASKRKETEENKEEIEILKKSK